MRKYIRLFSIIIFIFLSFLCLHMHLRAEDFSSTIMIILENNEDRLTRSSQAIIVLNEDTRSDRAKLYLMEKRKGKWSFVLQDINAAIGVKGFAFAGQKKEGDDKTPMGCFSITNAFGYYEIDNPGVFYTKINDKYIWITDPESPKYNQPATEANGAKSFIRLYRDNELYKYSVIIDYNTDPVEKGKGSAVFLHSQAEPGEPTSGSVAVDDRNMLYILKWLTVKKNPKILMGTDNILASGIY